MSEDDDNNPVKLFRPGRGPTKIESPDEDLRLQRLLMGQIDKLRKEQGHTHESFARAMGYSKQGYSHLANGRNMVRVDQVAKMAEILGWHLHVALRKGAADPVYELERLALQLTPTRLRHVVRIARAAASPTLPESMLAGTADYFESMTSAAQAAPSQATGE